MGYTDMPVQLKEGIYFHLSNDDYHADAALSHSGMTAILESWQDYWERSCHNPDRKHNKPTDAMELGTQTGMCLLDLDAFNKTYTTNPRFHKTHSILSTVQMGKIVDAVRSVVRVDIGKEHFSNGYPEVTIVWRDPDTGIMLRAKIDYLRTFGAIDFKRIKALDHWTIGRAVRDQGLDIQQFLYLEAIKAARRMLRAMALADIEELAIREGVSLDWLIAFRDEDDLLFRFLFQRSVSPYIWAFHELEPEVAQEGSRAVYEAIKRYKHYTGLWGLSKPPMGTTEIRTISPFHVPRRDYDYA